MDPVPTTPGFYVRRAIPGEVYHLESPTFTSPCWRLWVVGGRHEIHIPDDEMRRIAEIGDLVLLEVPDEREPVKEPIALKQGDVKVGDRVRLRIDGTLGREGSGFVDGDVYETASDGGVVGVKVGGVWFSAGLPFVTLLEVPDEREEVPDERETITLLHTRDDSEEHLHSYIHDAILHWNEENNLTTEGHSVMDLADAVWKEVASREVQP